MQQRESAAVINMGSGSDKVSRVMMCKFLKITKPGNFMKYKKCKRNTNGKRMGRPMTSVLKGILHSYYKAEVVYLQTEIRE